VSSEHVGVLLGMREMALAVALQACCQLQPRTWRSNVAPKQVVHG